jgi:hypothetical protein
MAGRSTMRFVDRPAGGPSSEIYQDDRRIDVGGVVPPGYFHSPGFEFPEFPPIEFPEFPQPAPIPLQSDEAAQRALAEQRRKAKRRRGYRSTIATSPQGVTGPMTGVGTPTLGPAGRLGTPQ